MVFSMPSSRIILSDSLRPSTSVTAGVNGVVSFATFFWYFIQSK